VNITFFFIFLNKLLKLANSKFFLSSNLNIIIEFWFILTNFYVKKYWLNSDHSEKKHFFKVMFIFSQSTLLNKILKLSSKELLLQNTFKFRTFELFLNFSYIDFFSVYAEHLTQDSRICIM